MTQPYLDPIFHAHVARVEDGVVLADGVDDSSQAGRGGQDEREADILIVFDVLFIIVAFNVAFNVVLIVVIDVARLNGAEPSLGVFLLVKQLKVE